MKYFTRFLNLCLFIFVLTSLAACKTMRTSEKTGFWRIFLVGGEN